MQYNTTMANKNGENNNQNISCQCQSQYGCACSIFALKILPEYKYTMRNRRSISNQEEEGNLGAPAKINHHNRRYRGEGVSEMSNIYGLIDKQEQSIMNLLNKYRDLDVSDSQALRRREQARMHARTIDISHGRQSREKSREQSREKSRESISLPIVFQRGKLSNRNKARREKSQKQKKKDSEVLFSLGIPSPSRIKSQLQKIYGDSYLHTNKRYPELAHDLSKMRNKLGKKQGQKGNEKGNEKEKIMLRKSRSRKNYKKVRNRKLNSLLESGEKKNQTLSEQTTNPLNTAEHEEQQKSLIQELERPNEKGLLEIQSEDSSENEELPTEYYERQFRKLMEQQCREEMNYVYLSKNEATKEWTERLLSMIEKHDKEASSLRMRSRYLERFDEQFFSLGILGNM